MKARLNLTIDDSLLATIKAYANKKQTSVSELVESYFTNLTKPSGRKTIIEMVEKLDKPEIDSIADLKRLYYEEQAGKYGL